MHASPRTQRVLFVDDEPEILSALARVLRPLRNEIESAFANSGAEALACLAKEPFDIVVADIRMPGMDGAALLDAVQRAHPHMIRMVLSGQAEAAAALRSVPLAHQFLAKPCEPAQLRTVILRAAGLHSLLQDRELQAVASGMREIPARPKLYTEISKCLADPLSTSRDICNLISGDVAMTAMLLKIVNSAFFGLPRRVTSIESAISYLGTSTLRSVILATAANTSLGPRAAKLGYNLDQNEAQALLSANLATQFFKDKNAREDAFAATLLQNVGELLLVAAAPDSALLALKLAAEKSMPLDEAERELGAVSHAHMGAYLLGAWGLPYSIVEAVAHHHTPSEVAHDKLDLVDAVYVGTLVAQHYLLQRPGCLERATEQLAKYGEEAQLAQIQRCAESWLKRAPES